ncbi:MAG: hypothetical protein ABFC28_07350 [Rikenellaceae bacterium]
MFFIHALQKRVLSRIRPYRDVKFMPLENVRSICFIFDMREEKIFEVVKRITSLMQDKKINYRGLAINLTKNHSSELALDCQVQVLTKDDLSIIGTPDLKIIEKVISGNADLFIDLSSTYSYTHDYISRSSLATFKIGRLNYPNNPFDLVIGSNGETTSSPMDFLKHLFHYLTSIKSA